MKFTLPKLPYSYEDLEPYIDKETMTIHYTKHHAGYVEKLNAALSGQRGFEGKSIEDILSNVDKAPEEIKQVVINNGGGHVNHSLFWEIMTPDSKKTPEGELSDAISSTFTGFEKFKEEFTKRALSLFGSGWVFLIYSPDKKLRIKRQSFQNSPLMDGNIPIIGIDVWEHAYYLKYQNKRADYVGNWWNVVNWKKANEIFQGVN